MMNKKHRELILLSFIVYIALLIYLLFFRHRAADIPLTEYIRYSTNFIPFFSFYAFFTTPYISYRVVVPFLINLIGNMVLFLPWGIALPVLNEKFVSAKRFFTLTAIVIIAVEILQVLLQVGTCDVEDFLLNMIGATAGFFISKRILKNRA